VVGRADDRPGRRAAQLELDLLAARVLADQVVAVDLGGALGVGRRDGGAALLLLRQGGHVDGTALDEAVQFLLTRGGRNLVQLRTRTQFGCERKLHAYIHIHIRVNVTLASIPLAKSTLSSK
jgi:hypothetical protein